MSENVAKKDLTARQYKAITSLLSGASKQRAAQECGVSSKTIERWLIDPVFNHELHKRSEFAIRRAAIRLAALLDTAAGVMYQAMTDPDRKSGIKLRAANSVFTHAVKLIETAEIMRRLDELEEAVKHAKP